MTNVHLNDEQMNTIRVLVADKLAGMDYKPAYLVGLLEVLKNAKRVDEDRNARLWALIEELKSND